MIITFQCTICKAELEVESDEVGDESPCPACGEQIMIPAGGIGPGTLLGGFDIIRKIGSGGMGEVFLARQVAMERNVALKVLPPAMTKNPATIQRFLHEVKMAARLEHPNIVTAFDAGEDDGYYYMAMSLVQGKDLDDIIHDSGPLPESQCLHIIRKTAEGLDYAWRRHHLLHRDIKPSNIMIDEVGDVKLMDMGIAKSVNEDSNMTIQGMLIGTPYYMSPEQAQCVADLDCRSDIYSLGATMYWMLTGARPFDGESVMGVIAKVLKDPIPPPEVKNPALSPGVCDLLRLMMAKDREDRPKDWQALLADIDAVGKKETPKTIQLRGPEGDIPLGPTAELAGLARDRDRTMVAAGADRTIADTSIPAPMPTQPVGGGAQGGSYESRVVNPEIPSSVRTILTVAATLFLLATVVGLIWFTVGLMNDRAENNRKERDAIIAAELRDSQVIGDVEGNIAAHQTTALVRAEEEARNKRLKKAYDYAVGYTRSNPDDPAGAISLFQELKRIGEGTEYSLMADSEIRKIHKASAATYDGYLKSLRSQVALLTEQHRYAEALALLNPNADSPFTAESRATKIEMAKGLIDKHRGMKIFLEIAEPQAGDLVSRDFDVVAKRLRESVRGPGRALAQPFTDQALTELQQLRLMPAEVAAAAGAKKGQDIDLVLKDGFKRRVRVVGHSGDLIEVSESGQLRRYTLADLHPGQVYQLLMDRTSPQIPSMQAIAALTAGHANVAANILAGDNSLTGLILRAEADRRRLAGTWQAATFAGTAYSGSPESVRITFQTDGSYQSVIDGTQATGTYSLREGVIYLSTPANRDRLPEIWTMEWVDTALTLSPRDGISMAMQKR